MKKVGSYNATLIPGDGIGPEVAAAAQRVIAATGVVINWEVVQIGETAIRIHGVPLPKATLDSVVRNRIALKGPSGTPVGSGFDSVNVELRKRLRLYANLRPVRSFVGIETRYPEAPIDLVVVRENVEDIYAGKGRYLNKKKTKASIEGFMSKAGSERVFRFGFEYAKRHGRKKVTAVHKGNIVKPAHGLFLKAGYKVAKAYPEIAFWDLIADNMSMQLVGDPWKFEVIVATNAIGDMLSDLCAGLIGDKVSKRGGLGLVPGANIGDNAAIFEAVHGTAPDIAGQGIANPTALILSAAMMLEYLGEIDAAAAIDRAVRVVIAEGKAVTRDIKAEGCVSTEKMTDAIIDALA